MRFHSLRPVSYVYLQMYYRLFSVELVYIIVFSQWSWYISSSFLSGVGIYYRLFSVELYILSSFLSGTNRFNRNFLVHSDLTIVALPRRHVSACGLSASAKSYALCWLRALPSRRAVYLSVCTSIQTFDRWLMPATLTVYRGAFPFLSPSFICVPSDVLSSLLSGIGIYLSIYVSMYLSIYLSIYVDLQM